MIYKNLAYLELIIPLNETPCPTYLLTYLDSGALRPPTSSFGLLSPRQWVLLGLSGATARCCHAIPDRLGHGFRKTPFERVLLSYS